MNGYSLTAEKRNVFGKKLKKEREAGKMPAVLYGKKEEAEPIFVSLKEFQKVLKLAGETSVIDISLENKIKKTMVYDVDFDPVSGVARHADFLLVKMDEPIEAVVPLDFQGEPEAVKAGGILVKALHELTVKALPGVIPHEIIIDISKLKTAEDKILIADISLPANVSIVGKESDEAVALIETPREETKDAPKEIDFGKIEAIKEKKEESEEKDKE